MPCPFPGMDPYLEHPAEWPQFHHLFINVLSELIADLLPPAYRARIAERSQIIDLTAGPVGIPLTVLDEATEGYIEIVHRPDRELVTVIEVLSPANKTGPGYEDFRAKRNALLRRSVHFVELDLLVGGCRPTPRSRPGTTARPSPGGSGGRWPTCTPGPSANRCRRSRCRCGHRTRTSDSTWRPRSPRPNDAAGTTGCWTAAS